MKLKGQQFKVSVDYGSPTPVKTQVMHETTCTLEISSADIDVTDKSSDDDFEETLSGRKSGSLKFSFFVSSAQKAIEDMMFDIFNNGLRPKWYLESPVAGTNDKTVNGRISSLSKKADLDNGVMYEVTVKLTTKVALVPNT